MNEEANQPCKRGKKNETPKKREENEKMGFTHSS